jgi:hypothetical protein
MSLDLVLVNSSSGQSASCWDPLDELSTGGTSDSCPSNLLGTNSSWQTSQPLSNMGDGTRNNTAALTHAPGDALGVLESPASMTWLTALHSTPIDRPHFMPHFVAPSKTSSHRERGKQLSNRGHVVNLYHVSQRHGEAFDPKGKLVSSAFITTDRRVSAVTGASGHSLDSAKLHTNIEWGVWRISYLGKIRKGEDVNQEIFAGVDPDVARSNLTGSNEHRLCLERKWESSHEQSAQTYNLDQHNQHEACEANQQSTPVTQMAPESSLASVHRSDHVTSTQPVGIEGTISNQQEAMQHTTTQSIPAIVRTTVQRKRYRHSNMTRAKQSMHSANAKSYHVEQANGDLFEYDGQLVAFAIIWTVAAVTEFLNCPRRTLYRKLKANGGIVKKVWRVKEYKNGTTST